MTHVGKYDTNKIMRRFGVKIFILILFAAVAVFYGARTSDGSEDNEAETLETLEASRSATNQVKDANDDSRYDDMFGQGMDVKTSKDRLEIPTWEAEEGEEESAAHPAVSLRETLEEVVEVVAEDVDADFEDEEEPVTGHPDRMNLEVSAILQNPELPTGCEITSLTMVLNWLGYPVDKVDMARKYLPHDGITGVDSPFDMFIGDPEKEYAYGCYPPVIVHTANAWLSDQKNYRIHAINYTGSTLDELFDYMYKEQTPVLVWVTQNLAEPYENEPWIIDGQKITWISPNHCVVLYGYNEKTKKVFVADPLVGNVIYDRRVFEVRYEEMGEKAVVIDLN